MKQDSWLHYIQRKLGEAEENVGNFNYIMTLTLIDRCLRRYVLDRPSRHMLYNNLRKQFKGTASSHWMNINLLPSFLR